MTKASDLHHDRLAAEAGRRLHADAAINNRDPILAVLGRHLPASGTVLEVGSGTGSFSRHLVESLSAGDVLDLCEINPNFAERLRSRFTSNGHHPNGPQIRVYEDSVLNLEPSEPYDFIVSGLPFNSFEPDFVSSVLTKYTEMLKPGGYLSFFEYLFIRELTYPFGSKNYRQRVSAVAEVMSQYYKDRNLESETVLLNIPPAVVHHLSQLNGNGSSGD